ncbi:MAG: hypothetical protein A2499_06740 [Stygiobacter sp. RIFOXYC12_FULL_38_8]|nr:MAG: hypothetical protein A2X62_16650 [Stygiobacter sp. GWC2_38_9]OGU85276.1 MAG: hypothetical protein A2279_13045 [Stygiobacter sp. RIFOXYA12_FULL_38_9]OGV05908.1 MAG: hypothetical protein A2299_10760 [Stygiobacter sp. RIFOXYB2_FULL_37_11]OGV10679.1 MAG: hypothetical protein A2237_10225 [Stygiobacter sp. RIFOXYA2_FULL_38_8]OGV14499.1 MAG: hypothetical protein A2440_08655 [Stygiobacter sp. RIFOXYC2_FULL_38_25]OGV28906.1 MAG: hypothetical protein A2499_06740 [Stygiobacter sp. RIFOXYC12_FULL_
MGELTLYFKYLVVVSIVVWLITPIRQYKTRYFWFFLIIGLTDPIAIIVGKSFNLVIAQLYIPLDILSFFSVIEYKKINVYKILFYLAIVGIGTYSFFHFWEYGSYFFTTVLFFVLVILIRQSFQFIVERGSINIFHAVLVFYQALNVFKSLTVLLNFSTGVWFYFISNVVQIFLGIFFALYREDDPRFSIEVMKVNKFENS